MNADRTPTVIFITHVVPYPPAAGNEIRILKLIKWLKGRGYKVVLLLNMDSLAPAIRKDLEKIVDGIYCRGEAIPEVKLPVKIDTLRPGAIAEEEDVAPEYKKWSDAVKKGLCPDKLMQMTYYYCKKYKPFAVIAEYIFAAPGLDVVPEGTLKLIDTIDMFSLKKEQVLSFGVKDPLHCTPAEEKAYLLKCDVIIAIQAAEAVKFRELVPERKVVTVGIDYDVVAEIDNSHVVPGRVLVVGSDNPLNVHGLQEFHRNAWPLIRAEHPNAVLRVIGKLGSKFQADDKSVEIAGWVESLDDEYSKASVVINPAVAGTGLKIKCVEALCHAKALVATPNGVEGLNYKAEAPFIVCNDWKEFSEAINSLLASENARLKLQETALRFAHDNFGTEQVYSPLSAMFPGREPAAMPRPAGPVARKPGKLRIAVWHNLPSGGGKRALYSHVKGLVERGHYVEAWCPDIAARDFLPLSNLIKENVVSFEPGVDNYGLKDPITVGALLAAMERHCEICGEQINAGGFDVLFANSCFIFRTSPIAKYVQLPSVLYLQEPYRNFYEALPELPWLATGKESLEGPRLQAREELEFAKKFDLILVNSVFSRESILRAYGLEAKVCYLGIDTEHYKPSGEPKDKYVIGFGYIYHGKGVDRAIRAVAAIQREKRPDLIWLGNSASQHDLRSYTLLAKELEVNFIPKINVPDSEVISLLSRALAMVYTSRLEPFGLAPLEANACGTPVVGIAEGGIRETMKEGISGFLAPDDNPVVLGELISRFVDDLALSVEMGARAREYVREHWNMTLSTDNIETHLGRLVEMDGTKFIKDLLANQSLVDKLSLASDIKMNVEELKSSGGKLIVRGWAFIDDGYGSRDSRIFIIAKYGPDFRLIKAGAVTRKDLTKHFGGKVDYDRAGFYAETKMPHEGISSLGILIRRGEKISLGFVKDDRIKALLEQGKGPVTKVLTTEKAEGPSVMSGDNGLIASGEVVYFSRCYPTAEGGGGCRRTAQLADALKDTGFRFVSVRDYYSGKYKGVPDFQDYLKSGDIPQWYISKWHPERRNDVAYMYYVSWLWSIEIAKSDSLKLALIDDPIYFAPLVRQLALRGIPVVALSQNIETLSRSQLMEEHQMALLNYELGYLSLCSLVVTISREENVFLTNLGVDTFYFPYYPVKNILQRMQGIREKRKAMRKEDFLFVGTAYNPPTMKGMEEIIRRWRTISSSLGGAKLYVAGYGTEPLKSICDGEKVVFKGTLSDEDLDNILTHIKGCIAYQGDGSGALTKICEFLLAGIPVLANSHAARSYYDVPGVVEFTSIDDLGKALKTVYAMEMTACTLVPPDSSLLAGRVKALLGAEGTAKAARIREAAEAMPPAGAQIAGIDAATSQELLRKAAQFDALQTELDEIKHHRNELLNSLSWRVTAPLRYIAKYFMRRAE